MNARPPIIAIDGPAGAGKSTIARAVAANLGYLYIDTGAMYRAVGWKAMEKGVDLRDEGKLADLAQSLRIELRQNGGNLAVFADGKEITGLIRTETVSRAANAVAVVEGVRKVLREKQRMMGEGGGVVMEGRDIGTAVFPAADYKFYLEASLEERARRRYEELKEKGGKESLEAVTRAMAERDQKDSSRAASPLKKAAGAIHIDSTGLEIRQTVAKILEHIR